MDGRFQRLGLFAGDVIIARMFNHPTTSKSGTRHGLDNAPLLFCSERESRRRPKRMTRSVWNATLTKLGLADGKLSKSIGLCFFPIIILLEETVNST